MTLDYVVGQLNLRKKRATYGAVAGIVGGLPRGLMQHRPKNHLNSWVLSKADGLPTGYNKEQIHPDCLRSILERPGDVIADCETLKAWLKGAVGVPSFRQL